MHERYLFPAIALLAPVWFAAPSLRWVCATLSVTFVGNCALEIFDVLGVVHHGIGALVVLFSALNVIALIALVRAFVIQPMLDARRHAGHAPAPS